MTWLRNTATRMRPYKRLLSSIILCVSRRFKKNKCHACSCWAKWSIVSNHNTLFDIRHRYIYNYYRPYYQCSEASLNINRPSLTPSDHWIEHHSPSPNPPSSSATLYPGGPKPRHRHRRRSPCRSRDPSESRRWCPCVDLIWLVSTPRKSLVTLSGWLPSIPKYWAK